MKIGIIGTGKMGTTLGRLWAGAGHDIYFGSRDPEKARQRAGDIGHGAQGGGYDNAVAFASTLLFAVPWDYALATIKWLNLGGKTLIDITNPFGPEGGLAVGLTTSAAEEIAAAAPGATVIKAFNAIHYLNLEQPRFGGQTADVYFCGDDEDRKASVAELIADIGLEPVDCGPLSNARYLEPLAILWIRLAFGQGWGTDFTFKLIRR